MTLAPARLALALALVLPACAQAPTATDDYARPAPGSYLLVDATPDQGDAIMTRVDALLAREPAYRPLALSNGLEGGGLYSFKFAGTCATRQALVAAVQAEVAKVTPAAPRCVDRR